MRYGKFWWVLLALFAFARSTVAAEFDYGPQPHGPHKTTERWGIYNSPAAQGDVRFFLVKPEGPKSWPGIYYIYGRPGLDHRLLPELRRLASYGFTVFVSHYQEALLIPILLPANDPPETTQVQIDGFNAFLALPERKAGPVCVASTVRGGNYGVLLAARPESACYVGYHAVLVYHGWDEYYQDVTIMPEIRKLTKPTLLMVGSRDFETRANQSRRTANYLRSKNIPVELVVYPEAARGFDFRVAGRTLADDMAKIDSMNRAVAFLNRHLVRNDAAFDTTPVATAPLQENTRIIPQSGTGSRPLGVSEKGPD